MSAHAAACRRAARAYGDVGITSGVDSADPHRLVLMLFEGAEEAIRRAKNALCAGHVAAKGEAISLAIQIVQEGLKASLDMKSGGGLAGQLSELYDYIARRLLLAGARNDTEGLDEAARLIHELHDAWGRIATSPGRKP